MTKGPFTPKTGATCSCRKGFERDNCPNCEGTGEVIDFRAIHAAREEKELEREAERGAEDHDYVFGDA